MRFIKRQYEFPEKYSIVCKEFEIQLQDEFIRELESVHL